VCIVMCCKLKEKRVGRKSCVYEVQLWKINLFHEKFMKIKHEILSEHT
jgi:hypothetical protein